MYSIIYKGSLKVWKVRNGNKSKDFKVTHQTHLAVRVFLFSGRTDTMCENNDHLFGHRGLVG